MVPPWYHGWFIWRSTRTTTNASNLGFVLVLGGGARHGPVQLLFLTNNTSICSFTLTGFIKPGQDGGVLETTLTYRELDDLTTRVAIVLRRSLQPGDRAVLVFPPSLDFMIAFIACLKAAVVAVPVFPPNPTRKDTLQMFGKIVAGCKANVALTNTEYNYVKKIAGITQVFGKLRGVVAWPENLQWVLTDRKSLQVSAAEAQAFVLPSPNPQDLAFLQYTSGKRDPEKHFSTAI